MSIGFIILARFNSRRLPGKALLPIEEVPLLLHIYKALRQVASPECIVVATSDQPTDDPIVHFCRQHKILCFRGSLDHVAQRFYQCAAAHHFDYATRINGDNLFVAMETLREMLSFIQTTPVKPDFLTNVKDRTFPYGMSVEMVKTSFYREVLTLIQLNPRYQEHVTLYLYEHEETGTRTYFYNRQCPEAKGINLAIDTEEDLIFARRMIQKMDRPVYSYNLPELYHIYLTVKKEHE